MNEIRGTTIQVEPPKQYTVNGIDLSAWRVAGGIQSPQAAFGGPAAQQQQTGIDFVPALTADMRIVLDVEKPQQTTKNLASIGLSVEQLPSKFSWTSVEDIGKYHQWKPTRSPLLGPVNQFACGDCWAVATATAFSDRVNIWNRKDTDGVNLSWSHLLSCMPHNGRCAGGSPSEAAKFLETAGTVESNACPAASYQWCIHDKACTDNSASESTLSGLVPRCTPVCGKVFTAAKGQSVALATREAIKSEILRNGPVVGVYRVFGDFVYGASVDGFKATKGVYMHYPNTDLYRHPVKGQSTPLGLRYVGNHAVVVVGWGVQDGVPEFKFGADGARPTGSTRSVPYWLIRNSWGEHWNDGGYFKLAMSDPESSLNSDLGLDHLIQINNVLFGGCTAVIPAGSQRPTLHTSRFGGGGGGGGAKGATPAGLAVGGAIVGLVVAVGVFVLVLFLADRGKLRRRR